MSTKGTSYIKGANKQFNEPSTCISGLQAQRHPRVADIKISMNNFLISKYAISSHFYYTKPIDSILLCERDGQAIRYAYDLDMLNQEEYLKKQYKKKEAMELVLQLAEYFKYHYEIPRLFMDNLIEIVDYFHDRRRNLIYQQVKEQIGKENIVGDESSFQAKERPTHSIKSYSSILKDLRPSEKTKPNDSLQHLLTQIQTFNSVGTPQLDLSIVTTTDNFHKEQMHFYQYMLKHGKTESDSNPIKIIKQIVQEKITGSRVNFKTKTSPTKVKANLSNEYCSPLKKSIEKLRETKEFIDCTTGKIATITKNSLKDLQSTKAKSKLVQNRSLKENHEKSGSETKKMFNVKKFQKEIEDFHLANSISNRKVDLFRSVKGQNSLTKAKSKSPKTTTISINQRKAKSPTLAESQILKTEPSFGTKSGLMNSRLNLNIQAYQPHSSEKRNRNNSKKGSAIKKQFANIRFSQNFQNETREMQKKSIEKNKNLKSEPSIAASNMLQIPFQRKNRCSFSNLATNSSPREYVLIKRLKSEERENFETFLRMDKKLQDNVIASLLKDQPIRVTSSSQRHQYQKSTTKLTSKTSAGNKISTFRNRAKVNSINLN